jgi:hypothetical protein
VLFVLQNLPSYSSIRVRARRLLPVLKNINFVDSNFTKKDYTILISEESLVDSMDMIYLHIFRDNKTYSASFKYLGKTRDGLTDSISFWNINNFQEWGKRIDFKKVKYLYGFRILPFNVTDGTSYFISYDTRNMCFDNPDCYFFSPFDILLSRFILHIPPHE